MQNSIEISESIDAVREGKEIEIWFSEEDIDFFPDIKGFLLPSEKRLIYHLAKHIPKKGTIVEIGCYEGLSAYFLAIGASKKDGHVYSIDLFGMQQDSSAEDGFKDRYEKQLSKDEVMKNLNRYGLDNITLVKEKSNYAAKTWKKKINLLFIDGNHNYQDVRKDILSWSKHLVPGGIMMIHDANTGKDIAGMPLGLEGPKKAIDELITENIWKDRTYAGSMFFAKKR